LASDNASVRTCVCASQCSSHPHAPAILIAAIQSKFQEMPHAYTWHIRQAIADNHRGLAELKKSHCLAIIGGPECSCQITYTSLCILCIAGELLAGCVAATRMRLVKAKRQPPGSAAGAHGGGGGDRGRRRRRAKDCQIRSPGQRRLEMRGRARCSQRQAAKTEVS
jgi:hypothetical protein